MNLTRRLLVAGAVLALAGTAGYAWHRHVSSPAYALRQVARAVREHDRTAFERRVDVDRFVESTVDELYAIIRIKSAEAALRGEGEPIPAEADAELARLRPTLISELRAQALRAVEKGTLDSVFAGGPRSAAIAGTLSDAPRFVGLGRIRRDGHIATAEMRMRDDLAGATYALRLRMERGPHGWRVQRLDNLREYVDESLAARDRRLAEENGKVQRRLSGMIEVGIPERIITPGIYYSLGSMRVAVPVRNVGRDTIAAVKLWLVADGTRMPQDDAQVYYMDRPLAPGESGVAATMQLEYDPYHLWHSTLRFSSLTASVHYVRVRRGGLIETVGQFNGWDEYVESRREGRAAPAGTEPRGMTS